MECQPSPSKPQPIVGSWSAGCALDLHTSRSEFLGHDEFGHPMFDTVRTAVGEALYQLKYAQNSAMVSGLAETAAAFVRGWKCRPDLVLPVPATKDRAVPPVALAGQKLLSDAHEIDSAKVRGRRI